jgi:hypothetical protein
MNTPQTPPVKTRAEKIFDDLATGFACIQVTTGINMSKAVYLLNDLALLFKESETKREFFLQDNQRLKAELERTEEKLKAAEEDAAKYRGLCK